MLLNTDFSKLEARAMQHAQELQQAREELAACKTPAERRDCKARLYLRLYRAGPQTLAQRLGTGR